MTEIVRINSSIPDLRSRYIDGSETVVKLIDRTLDTIERKNPDLNAFTYVGERSARERARELDKQRNRGGPLGALHGIPVAIKDNIDVRGMPNTAGIEAYRDRIAFTDAVVTQKLIEAGAVIVGKTNLPEGALGATTENRLFGITDHPISPGFTPGGSSGGSACAVASGMVPVAIGTDTLGSVRIPSAYCGIVGVKPTNGRVSLRGVVPLKQSYDTVGPIAGNCGDLTIAYQAICGFDPQCEHSIQPPEASLSQRRESLVGLKVYCPVELENHGVEEFVLAAYERLVSIIVEQGATVIREPLAIDLGQLRRHALLLIERAAAAVHGERMAENALGFSEHFHHMLKYGVDATEQRITEAEQHLREIQSILDARFTDAQMLVLPTAPQLPFAHEEPVPNNQADFTSLANIMGAPALNLPVAHVDGRYAGVQLMMRRFNDELLLKLGVLLEKQLNA